MSNILSVSAMLAVLNAFEAGEANPIKILPCKAAKGSKGKAGTTQFFNIRITIGGTDHRIKIVFEGDNALSVGFCGNPAESKFISESKSNNVSIDVIQPNVQRLLELLQKALFARLAEAVQSGADNMPGRMGTRKVHNLYEVGELKYNESEKTGFQDIPAELYAKPRWTLKAKLEKRSMDHVITAFRGTSETTIYDASRPKMATRADGSKQINGFEIASVEGRPVEHSTLYQFMTRGSRLTRSVIELDSIIYSASFISAPAVITSAIVQRADASGEQLDWAQYAATTALNNVPAAAPAVAPTAAPAVKATAADIDDLDM